VLYLGTTEPSGIIPGAWTRYGTGTVLYRYVRVTGTVPVTCTKE